MELTTTELTLFWLLTIAAGLVAAHRIRGLILVVARGRPLDMEPGAWRRL